MKKFLFYTTIFMLISCMVVSFSKCKKEQDEPEEATPTASFTASKTNVKVLETVYFSNSSTNASRYEWAFGDGNTSTEQSPNHSYYNEGIYTVRLTAYSASGAKKSETTTTIYVTNPVGDAMFWMSQETYIITVTLLDQTKSITSYYPSTTPTCGDIGCANFPDIEVGTYSYYAENSLYWWSGTITITEGDCSKMRLYFTKANLRSPQGEKTGLLGPLFQ